MPSSSRRTSPATAPTSSSATAQPSAANIRTQGFDFRVGDTLLEAGRRIGPRELSLAAAMGHGELPVRRRPRVAVLATGDELVQPGGSPGPARSSPPITWASPRWPRPAGAEARLLGIARDTRESLDAHIAKAADADVLVTIGGASVGDHDLVAPVLEARGMALAFWKIAMRPGKPLMFGRLGDARVLGLPGNPVSAIVCARVFLVPLIRALLGRPDSGPGPAARPAPPWRWRPTARAQHYMRATSTTGADGRRRGHPGALAGQLPAGAAGAGRLPAGPPRQCARRAGRQPRADPAARLLSRAAASSGIAAIATCGT